MKRYTLNYLGLQFLFLLAMYLVFPNTAFFLTLTISVMAALIHTAAMFIYYNGFRSSWYFLFWRFYKNKFTLSLDVGYFAPGDVLNLQDCAMLVLRRKEKEYSFEYTVKLK